MADYNGFSLLTNLTINNLCRTNSITELSLLIKMGYFGAVRVDNLTTLKTSNLLITVSDYVDSSSSTFPTTGQRWPIGDN